MEAAVPGERSGGIFGKDATVAQYDKRIRELEQLLGRKEVETAFLPPVVVHRETY